jgi:hypothetical protein
MICWKWYGLEAQAMDTEQAGERWASAGSCATSVGQNGGIWTGWDWPFREQVPVSLSSDWRKSAPPHQCLPAWQDRTRLQASMVSLEP